MCKYCDDIKNPENHYWPVRIDRKTINFGVLGKSVMYLIMRRDVETEDCCITAEFDPPLGDDFFFAENKINYCPFCGEPLDK